MLAIILSTFAAIFAVLYYLLQRRYNYWKKRNVPYIKPTPLLGNYGDFILQKKDISSVMEDLCKKMPNEPYIGVFYGTGPTLIVRDLELLKLITTKDFYYFHGREVSDHVHKEELTNNLFNSAGDEWKVMRQNLTPVFTSAKMKSMFPLIRNCSYEFEKLLDSESKMDGFEARIQVGRFTMACILSCGFGVDSGTMNGEYDKNNPFVNMGDAFFSVSPLSSLAFTLRSLWPTIFYALGLEIAPARMSQIMKNFMNSIFEARNYKSTSRNDFIDFILKFKQSTYLVGDSISNSKTGDNKKEQVLVTDTLLTAQCIVFFLAGYETSATTSNFTLYELAKHPEVQRKVQEEIDAYLQKTGNQLNYDVVTELPYTYACIEETMRLFPVLGMITREVMDAYTMPNGVLLEKGTRIYIPIREIQRDPKHFPEPEVFRPERFLGEERQKIAPYSYMPFGEGSRICLGMRFAKMQMLAGLVTLLKKFNVELADKNQTIVFDPLSGVTSPKIPLKFKVTPREGWESRVFTKN
uniref:unspecific monooxygenase n=2 Tax=Cnaphalocrocis medinalis TaxID=437488 RepID=C7U1L4_CNAME|nr:CYP6AE30 protein [Cnaphalocrocis medinalis]